MGYDEQLIIPGWKKPKTFEKCSKEKKKNH